MMKPYLHNSLCKRFVACALVFIQVLIGMPADDLTAAVVTKVQQAIAASKAIRPNRTVPRSAPVALFPSFSAQPKDAEITRARVFEEPLVPMSSPATTAGENADLAKVLTSYLKSGDTEDLSLLEEFLDRNPDSAWRASLLTDMGIVYRKTGYYSKALAAWGKAWELSRSETEPLPQAMANRALAEWAELNARLGRYYVLEPLFEEIQDRSIGGSAEEKLRGAKQGLWLMENRPQDAFRCGPMALDRILAFQRGASYRRDDLISNSESTKKGLSLPQVLGLGNTLGMNMQMAKRTGDADVLLPAVVHWKAGHYAALLKEEDGRYLVQDPTFGDELWVSRKALNAESSGYFLVGAGELPEGWSVVSQAEGGEVWGKGNTGSDNIQHQKEYDAKAKGSCGCSRGMPEYDVHLMLVSLNITDIPVGYTPPRGPSVDFHITYNHREAFQPSIFSYSNLGPKWTFDWMTYITDNPSNLSASVTWYVQGGGQETYSGYDSGTQSYAPHFQSHAIVVRTSTSPIRYELRMPDGSVRVFEQPDGASTNPRKIFMTQWIDPVGNGITLTYDSSLRLTAVTDAIGQVTTLSYEDSSSNLRITKVTDPFGRYATLAYNANGRLQSVTDEIGLQSSFDYTSSDFIRAMTTPYGKTSFLYYEAGRNRWIEATDPLGGTERVEFRPSAPGIADSVPVNEQPVGMSTIRLNQQFRNSFYWDKRTYALYPGNYTKAQLTHWLHDIDGNVTSGVMENSKMPLEGRVWYQYPDQGNTTVVGGSTKPIAIGRILDDGSTQLIQFAYNKVGKIIKVIDPLGRQTDYVYGTGNTADSNPSTGTGIDLLQIKQKHGGSFDVLASFTYNSHHQPLTSTDAALQTTTATYTSHGDLETIVTPARGSLTTAQRTTTFTYNADNASYGPGQPASVTGPISGATTSFAYDDHGRLATVTGSDGYAVTTAFDALDRPTLVTYPDSTTEAVTYDKLDANASRDRLGRWTHYIHDAERRPVATRDPQGRTVSQKWCNCGVLEAIIDANGNATSWTLDGQNRVILETRANAGTIAQVYETTTSRLKRRTNLKGEHTDYTYFKDNNINTVSYPNPGKPTSNVSYTYDTLFNRVATMVDGIGTTSYAYNAITTSPGTLGAGALASIDGPLSNDTIAYGYDELGRVVSRGINSVAASMSYDPLGRVDAVTNALGSFGYSYVNQTGRLSSVSYPNGQTTEYGYFNNAGDVRLQQIHNKLSGGATLSKFDYAYDTIGQLTTWTQQRDDGVSAVTRAYDFKYDRAGQLTLADYRTTGGSPTILTRYAYNYDTSGNRTGEQIDDTSLKASYNSMNRMTSRDPGGPLYFAGTVDEAASVTIQGKPAEVTADNRFSGTTVVSSGSSSIQVAAKDYSGNLRTSTYDVSQSGSTTSYTYDSNGNLTGDGTRTFEWDVENRLLAVEAGANRSEFTYDGLGRRVRIVEKVSGSTTSDHWFLWCGTEMCEERNSAGSTVTKRFFEQGVEIGSTDYFYSTDHLGSIREMTDGSGAIQARYDYDPYGRQNKLSGSLDADFGFTGHYEHAPTGLALTLYRAYDPTVGRWLSEDPLGFGAGWNNYAYVNGNPVSFVDPLGLTLEGGAEAFVQNMAIGAAAVFVLATMGPAGAAVGIILAAVAVYGLYQLYQSWKCLTPDQKDEAIGGILGGAVGAVGMASVIGGGSVGSSTAASEEAVAVTSAAKGVLIDANFVQRNFSLAFSSEGAFAGRTVEGVAAALRSGKMGVADVPVQYIIRDGNTLILNTRSAQALEAAGIPRALWNAVNMTGDAAAEARLAGQLQRNGLGSQGIPAVVPGKR